MNVQKLGGSYWSALRAGFISERHGLRASTGSSIHHKGTAARGDLAQLLQQAGKRCQRGMKSFPLFCSAGRLAVLWLWLEEGWNVVTVWVSLCKPSLLLPWEG